MSLGCKITVSKLRLNMSINFFFIHSICAMDHTHVNMNHFNALEKYKLCRTAVGNPPHPPRLTDLFLWLLGLQGITVGSVTVWAVMFTVVIRCFGIRHNQKLLNVTLKTEK